MKGFRNTLFYLAVIGGCSALIYWIMLLGSQLEAGRQVVTAVSRNSKFQDFIEALGHNLQHPIALLLAQIITIILVARLFGWICKKIGQPSVVGEIIAGIVLGPSLAGMYFPGFSAFLFPVTSLGNLQFLSQIGLVLFMFIIGMELDLKVLRNKAHEAVVISHTSIVFPFALGVGLAYFIYEHFAPQGINFASFALFTGIAMSITAFPVLARIIQERGIHKTRLGTIVITCAAADDITAWCILAAVIAIVKAGSFVSALYTMALALLYVLVAIKIVRPFLQRVGDFYLSKEPLSKAVIAIFFLMLIISSYLTEVIGIHALFGAFMAGAIMPENVKFRSMFIEKVEDISLVLLLPLFFVFTGLRTQIGLLNDMYQWQVTGLIILVAVTGKFVGSAVAAKVVGQSWKDSLTIGALMNTRGLMELVVLNIGYDLGVLKPDLFAMMVIMALVTTFMTGPALDIINWWFRRKAVPASHRQGSSQFNLLISFNNTQRGRSLLRLAHAMIGHSVGRAKLTALHLAPVDDLHLYNIDAYEQENFAPLVEESKALGQEITTVFKASGDMDNEIADYANKNGHSLLLVGIGQSIYEGSLLGRILGFTSKIINPERLLDQVTGKDSIFDDSIYDEHTRVIVQKSRIPVGVFIDKGMEKVRRVFIPALSTSDDWLIEHVERLVVNSQVSVSVLDAEKVLEKTWSSVSAKAGRVKEKPLVQYLQEGTVNHRFLDEQDLMVVSEESWRLLIEAKTPWLQDICSTVILVPAKS